jgi:hypothetical protein
MLWRLPEPTSTMEVTSGVHAESKALEGVSQMVKDAAAGFAERTANTNRRNF